MLPYGVSRLRLQHSSLCSLLGYALLYSVLFPVFFSCSHGATATGTTTSNPAPENSGVSTTSSSTTTTTLHVGPVKGGEIPDLLRIIMKPSADDRPILPEDFEYGPVLDLNPADAELAAPAQQTVRNWIQAIKGGKSIESYCTKDAAKFSVLNFAPQQKLLSDLNTIRFLSDHRINESIADFEVLLATATGRAKLSFYLIPGAIKGNWLISDIQGDLATLSQSVESQYTGYAPQDAERQLIREGHNIQWP